MRVDLATVVDASPEVVWREVQTPRLLGHIARPLIRFTPIDPPKWPERFADGRCLVGMRLFGLVPLGRQWIVTSRPDGASNQRLLRDDGRGTLVRRWKHLIQIAPHAGGGTSYRDTVEVAAGVLTPVVAAFALLFYRHRQRRLRRLAGRGFQY